MTEKETDFTGIPGRQTAQSLEEVVRQATRSVAAVARRPVVVTHNPQQRYSHRGRLSWDTEDSGEDNSTEDKEKGENKNSSKSVQNHDGQEEQQSEQRQEREGKSEEEQKEEAVTEDENTKQEGQGGNLKDRLEQDKSLDTHQQQSGHGREPPITYVTNLEDRDKKSLRIRLPRIMPGSNKNKGSRGRFNDKEKDNGGDSKPRGLRSLFSRGSKSKRTGDNDAGLEFEEQGEGAVLLQKNLTGIQHEGYRVALEAGNSDDGDASIHGIGNGRSGNNFGASLTSRPSFVSSIQPATRTIGSIRMVNASSNSLVEHITRKTPAKGTVGPSSSGTPTVARSTSRLASPTLAYTAQNPRPIRRGSPALFATIRQGNGGIGTSSPSPNIGTGTVRPRRIPQPGNPVTPKAQTDQSGVQNASTPRRSRLPMPSGRRSPKQAHAANPLRNMTSPPQNDSNKPLPAPPITALSGETLAGDNKATSSRPLPSVPRSTATAQNNVNINVHLQPPPSPTLSNLPPITLPTPPPLPALIPRVLSLIHTLLSFDTPPDSPEIQLLTRMLTSAMDARTNVVTARARLENAAREVQFAMEGERVGLGVLEEYAFGVVRGRPEVLRRMRERGVDVQVWEEGVDRAFGAEEGENGRE